MNQALTYAAALEHMRDLEMTARRGRSAPRKERPRRRFPRFPRPRPRHRALPA
jgi:hypothetical protein